MDTKHYLRQVRELIHNLGERDANLGRKDSKLKSKNIMFGFNLLCNHFNQ